MATILVVEDDTDIRREVAELLRDEGHEVVTAENGADALAWLNAGHRPCVILLDLMMPILDGWAFRSEQLSNPRISSIPVVLLSAAGDLRKHAASLQVAGCVPKPFGLAQVLAAVSKIC